MLAVALLAVLSFASTPSSEATEIALALSAAPRDLRSTAGVWVRTRSGYHQARRGSNGLQCIVAQETSATLEPQCYDADSAATLLPIDVYRRERQMLGENTAAVDRDVRARYADRTFRPPRAGDIVYMLSNDNYVLVSAGRVVHFAPHLMITAPFKRVDALGGANRYAFLIHEGEPDALIIIRVDDSH
ncbi:MAG TPA: hypothetical protein VIW73_00710 [Candidatus Cybelea sp.]